MCMDPKDPLSLPSTDWSLVERAGGVPGPPQREAMQLVVARYLPALRAHVIARWRFPAERAEDLLQEFLSVKVVEEELLGQVRRDRGRFRHFIRTTLDHFVISQVRKEQRQKRSPDEWDEFDPSSTADGSAGEPSAAFDVAWAREVIATAVDRMSDECHRQGRADLWGLFEERVLRPALEGVPPTDYDALVARHGFRSPLQAANALTTAKRMLERNLRTVLREFAPDEEDVEEELIELRSVLAGNRARA